MFPGSRLTGQANLLIMPNGDAAHIAYSLLKTPGGDVTVARAQLRAERLPANSEA